MLLIAGSVSTGLLLGLRYRVFILLPAILVGGISICAISPLPLSQTWMSVLTFVAVLQLGYVGGALVKFTAGGRVRAEIPGELGRIRLH